MNRSFVKFIFRISGFIAIAFVYNDCNRTRTCEGKTIKDVCLTIINESGLDTKLIKIIHEKDIIEAPNLKNGTSNSIIIRSPGENVYHVIVIFANNDTLVSNEEYIEGGYSVIERIGQKSIETEYPNNY